MGYERLFMDIFNEFLNREKYKDLYLNLHKEQKSDEENRNYFENIK